VLLGLDFIDLVAGLGAGAGLGGGVGGGVRCFFIVAAACRAFNAVCIASSIACSCSASDVFPAARIVATSSSAALKSSLFTLSTSPLFATLTIFSTFAALPSTPASLSILTTASPLATAPFSLSYTTFSFSET
jgi:hypothetical protein